MTTFRELLTSVRPEELAPELERIFGDRWSVDALAFYLKSIDQMLASSPLPEDQRAGVLVVKTRPRPDWCEDCEETLVLLREDDGVEYEIDFVPWQDLLDIPLETVLDPVTTAAEIVAEMTFWGSPEEQEETVKMLLRRMAEADPGRRRTEEESFSELKALGPGSKAVTTEELEHRSSLELDEQQFEQEMRRLGLWFRDGGNGKANGRGGAAPKE